MSSAARVIQSYWDHAAAGRTEELFALIADEFVLYHNSSLPYGGTYTGLSEFKRFMSIFNAMVTDLHVTIHEIFANESGGIAVGTLKARVAESGKPIDTMFCELFEVTGDKITVLRPFYFDTAALLKQF